MKFDELQPENYYSFTTTVPSVLGAGLTRVKYHGKVSYQIARMIESIDIKHRQVYHHLTGAVDNPAAYSYHIFEGADGSKAAFAEPWIVENSITLIENTRIQVTIENLDVSDIEVIRQLLIAGDFNNFKINVF